MRTKFFFFILLIITIIATAFFCLIEIDKSNQVGDIAVIQIRNKNLLPILDSIIIHEKQCDYYTPNLIFSIQSRRVNNNTEYQIGSVGSWLIDFGSKNYYGCFEYKGHRFVVGGQKLDSSIFTETTEIEQFVFLKPNENFKNGGTVLNVIDDDTFSYWIYNYTDNKFIFKEMNDTYCNCSKRGVSDI